MESIFADPAFATFTLFGLTVLFLCGTILAFKQ